MKKLSQYMMVSLLFILHCTIGYGQQNQTQQSILKNRAAATLKAPTLTFPNNGEQLLQKEVTFRGTAAAGATVSFAFSPESTGGQRERIAMVQGSQNPYDQQVYTAKADHNGQWQIKPFRVLFPTNAKNRFADIHIVQSLDGKQSAAFTKRLTLPDNSGLHVKAPNDLKKVAVANVKPAKKYILTITLSRITLPSANEVVKLGVSQWTDVYVKGNAIANRTGQSNEMVCWWDKVCQEPRVVIGSTAIEQSRTYALSDQDINDRERPAKIDIWTKYIANYPLAKNSVEIKDVIHPLGAFVKKTVGKLDDKGFHREPVLVKDVLASNGRLNKKVMINFNNSTYTFHYLITLKEDK